MSENLFPTFQYIIFGFLSGPPSLSLVDIANICPFPEKTKYQVNFLHSLTFLLEVPHVDLLTVDRCLETDIHPSTDKFDTVRNGKNVGNPEVNFGFLIVALLLRVFNPPGLPEGLDKLGYLVFKDMSVGECESTSDYALTFFHNSNAC